MWKHLQRKCEKYLQCMCENCLQHITFKLDTPRKDWNRVVSFRVRLGLRLELTLKLTPITNSNTNTNTNLNTSTSPNPNLALKLTTRFQSFLDNLILEYPVQSQPFLICDYVMWLRKLVIETVQIPSHTEDIHKMLPVQFERNKTTSVCNSRVMFSK